MLEWRGVTVSGLESLENMGMFVLEIDSMLIFGIFFIIIQGKTKRDSLLLSVLFLN